MTKIAILGAGSIGCWIGGHLASGGADVVLIGRQRYAEEIASHGLTLTHFKRETIHLSDIDFVTDIEVLESVDIICVCTKSQDTEKAARQIAMQGRRGATVISFQNGIRNVEILRSLLPAHMMVIPAIVPFNVTPSGPGAFHCGTAGDLILGEVLHALSSALAAAGENTVISNNIIGDQWAKMIVNLNNGLNTLTGRPLLETMVQRDYRRALAACLEEALEIAHAVGVDVGTFNGRKPSFLMKTLRLPNWAYRFVMQRMIKIDAQARSSMLDDLEAGRGSEVEFLQGEIIRQAEKVGRSAPKSAAVKRAVDQAFATGKSPQLTGTELLKLVS